MRLLAKMSLGGHNHQENPRIRGPFQPKDDEKTVDLKVGELIGFGHSSRGGQTIHVQSSYENVGLSILDLRR